MTMDEALDKFLRKTHDLLESHDRKVADILEDIDDTLQDMLRVLKYIEENTNTDTKT